MRSRALARRERGLPARRASMRSPPRVDRTVYVVTKTKTRGVYHMRYRPVHSYPRESTHGRGSVANELRCYPFFLSFSVSSLKVPIALARSVPLSSRASASQKAVDL